MDLKTRVDYHAPNGAPTGSFAFWVENGPHPGCMFELDNVPREAVRELTGQLELCVKHAMQIAADEFSEKIKSCSDGLASGIGNTEVEAVVYQSRNDNG